MALVVRPCDEMGWMTRDQGCRESCEGRPGKGRPKLTLEQVVEGRYVPGLQRDKGSSCCCSHLVSKMYKRECRWQGSHE